MNAPLDKFLLEEVTLLKPDIDEAFIEKDWFVTQVIKTIAESPYFDFLIVFTGGTALSKAHKLIDRFSEDVDFRIIAPGLVYQGVSVIRKSLSGFKHYLTELLQQEFEVLQINARDNNRYIKIHLAYPTVCQPSAALRPHIKLEFVLSELLLPSVNLPVSSIIHEVIGRPSEVSKIACINPVENAADKLSALVWRVPSRVRGENDKQPEIVRHLHDLAKLKNLILAHNQFSELAKITIERDTNRAAEIQGLTMTEKLYLMIRSIETDAQYFREYETYVKAMVYGDSVTIPTFMEAIASLKAISNKIVDFSPT